MKLDSKEGNDEVDLRKMIYNYVRNDLTQMITDIIGYIFNLFSPILFLIGEFIILVINFLFNFFPDNFLWLYIIISIGLVVAGLIVNMKWPGIEYTSVFQRTRESEQQEQLEP